MKRIYCIGMALMLAGSAWAAENTNIGSTNKTSGGSSAFPEKRDKYSYAVGMNIGKSFRQSELDINMDKLVQGIKDAMAGGTNALLTEAEQQETVRNLSMEMRQKQEEKRKIQGEKNKVEGEKFLAENAKKEGVKTLPSGLQYKVIKEGSGPMPKATDQVKCNYRGTLIDGTEFDSSYKRGEPTTFRVNQVIKGWSEALQLMKAGSKWELYIPSNLAYGERGQGPIITPNATLVFDIELLEVIPGTEAAAPKPSAPVTSDIIKVPSAEEMKKGAKIEVIKPGSSNYPPDPNSIKVPPPAKK